MPSIPLHISLAQAKPHENPLPALLRTPTGYALLELQGTIHFPPPTSSTTTTTLVGKLVFPLYNPDLNGEEDTKWMKRVYFYIGENQRMTGECKKLPKPIAVVRKRGVDEGRGGRDVDMEGGEGGAQEALEIVEVVRWKVVFSLRPEPVSDVVAEKEEV